MRQRPLTAQDYESKELALDAYFSYVLKDLIRRELLDPESIPIHEAGHAVVDQYHSYQVTKATVEPNYFSADQNDLYIGQVEYDPPWPDDDEAALSV